MNRRLLIDSLRRNWVSLLIKAGFGTLIWIAAGGGLVSTGTAIAASMALAQLAGPGLAIRLVAPREVLILPMSRQEIWRTRFLYGIAVVAIATTSGKLLGLWISEWLRMHAPGLGTIAMSGVLDVVYAAVGTWVVWLSFVSPDRSKILFAAGVIALLLSPFLPFTVADRLPTALAQLNVTSLALLVAGLAIGALSYFSTPRLVAAPSPTAARAALKSRRRGIWPEFDRLTGLKRLVLKAWAGSIAVQVGTIVSIPIVLLVTDWLIGDPSESWLDYARHMGLLPFELSDRSPNWVMCWIFASVGSESTGAMLRHLRTLPFSTRALTSVLMSVSFTTWTSAWLVLAAFHVLTTGGPPQTWQLPWFAGFVGLDCFFRAFQLRWRRSPLSIGAALLLVAPVVFIVSRLPVSADVLFLASSGAALLLAAVLNHHTLTTNRAAYARMPRRTAFGTELPT
jgi:hypothetical protein